MGRTAKPYIERGWYCTDYGGVKRQRLCTVDKGRREADICLSRLKGQIADGSYGDGLAPPVDKTVTEVLGEFLLVTQGNVESSSFEFFRRMLEPFHSRFKLRPIKSLTVQDGIEYKKWLMTEKTYVRGSRNKAGVLCGTTHTGLGPTSVRHYLSTAKHFLRWASRAPRCYIPRDPWVEVRMPQPQVRERIFTNEEFRILLDNCRDGNIKGGRLDWIETLTFLRLTAMRPHELCNIRWSHRRKDKHQIILPPTDRRTGQSLNKTKTRRAITLITEAEEILDARASRLGTKGYIFCGVTYDTENHRYVFDPEKRRDPNSMSSRFGELVEKCVKAGLIEKEKGGERLVLYTSRHTRATELVAADVPSKAVMNELGHKHFDTTSRYTHLVPEFQTQVIRDASTTYKKD